MDITEELMNISARMLLSTDRQDIISLSTELNDIARRTIELSMPTAQSMVKSTTTILYFTKKELQRLPNNIRKEFIKCGGFAHVIRKISSKKRKTYCYEVRLRRKPYNISVASVDLAKAKEEFLSVLASGVSETPKAQSTSFAAIAEEWFENKKPKVVEDTYRIYRSLYDRLVYCQMIGLFYVESVSVLANNYAAA